MTAESVAATADHSSLSRIGDFREQEYGPVPVTVPAVASPMRVVDYPVVETTEVAGFRFSGRNGPAGRSATQTMENAPSTRRGVFA
jgi:hypothetical protein